jgi:hypothetical protein
MHPRAFQNLTKFIIGELLDATPEACRRVAEAAPVVAFRRRAA